MNLQSISGHPGSHGLPGARRLLAAACLLASALATGCASTRVQPWERGDLAMDPMAASDMACQRFEHNIEAYREGAVGANGGKSGGGCGCS